MDNDGSGIVWAGKSIVRAALDLQPDDAGVNRHYNFDSVANRQGIQKIDVHAASVASRPGGGKKRAKYDFLAQIYHVDLLIFLS